MANFYCSSVSCWVIPECEPIFLNLYHALAFLQKNCNMPLGQALAKFEMHRDDAKKEAWCRDFTDNVRGIFQSKKDHGPGRPYRGDAWLREQIGDERLDEIFQQYDRRFEATA
ncbi:hypothetical protein M0657_010876 [Pyricularia oryzae]|nr:hypothetical protein M0657_010876 [Pyricularia oryzae]